MINGTLQCDVCGRVERVRSQRPEGWGELKRTTANGRTRRQDVCLGCIARLDRWDNPYVAGTGLRLREYAARSA